MSLKYDEFKNMHMGNKTIFIDDFFNKIDIESINQRELKKFLRNTFENESNPYIKKKTLDIICSLTFAQKLNTHFTLDLLLDIDDTYNPFIIATTIKYLSLFYDGTSDNDIIETIEQFKDHYNIEVVSEAYYRLGILKFHNLIQEDEDPSSFLKYLFEAEELFSYSKNITENRSDAEFYVLLIRFLSAFVQSDLDKSNSLFNNLTHNLWIRNLYHLDTSLLDIDFKLYNILNNLYKINQKLSDVDGWLNFEISVKQILLYHYDIMNQQILNNKVYRDYLETIKNNIKTYLMYPYYAKSFSRQAIRIDNLLNQLSEDESDLRLFLDELKSILAKNSDKKKEPGNEYDIIKLVDKFKNIFPKEDVKCLYDNIKELDNPNNSLEVCSLIEKYAKKTYKNTNEIITGHPTGEEIFKDIQGRLQKSLIDYPPEKLNIFLQLLEHIIMYAYDIITSPKSKYLFLYSNRCGGSGLAASERDLQDSIYEYLNKTRLSSFINYEKTNFSNGGRVDFEYKCNDYTFPVEIKKTSSKITDEAIKTKYLGQIQTYIHPYNQLGMFIILDLNEQPEGVPDIKTQFKIFTIDSLCKNSENKFQDYIIVVTIPGNRLLPSGYCNYG
ncbi:hypothetical protein FDB73_03730 [Clostridium botulinum]|nr:hypothetical protein [Clostridium botulinum]NFP54770.1 hypothetical protein [Clostridium botulinum]NFT12371.1 hypothetical protein [Clostridium botulinum]NFT60711.1 hypothetical protein [Clostridium botulinum]